jgi:hypothetical protein
VATQERFVRPAVVVPIAASTVDERSGGILTQLPVTRC